VGALVFSRMNMSPIILSNQMEEGRDDRFCESLILRLASGARHMRRRRSSEHQRYRRPPPLTGTIDETPTPMTVNML
jgi:hypothetical protein